MHHKLLILLTVVLWSVTTLPLRKEASAETALNRAIVQNLRNLVRLIPQNRVSRPARVSDAIKPGDALSTGRSSLAELRFNDGSLARIGEQAVFRFLAKTRNFNLSNGTVLLLIPPGRGITGVQTPNAAAAIRGSALFVRYIPGTNTTIVGSLTNSNIEVFNEGGSQSEVLEAGQMAVIVEDRIESLYEFDLNTFYETSDLVQELDLDQPSKEESSDPAIASVQAETSEAAAAQPPIVGEGVIENPAFVQPSATSDPTPVDNTTTSPTPVNPPVQEPPVAAPINPPETPAANPQETPVNNPIDTPTDDIPETPVNNPIDTPIDDSPAETPVDTPPVDTPTDDTPQPPVDTPTDDTPEPPVDTPPVDTPPVDTPTDDTPEPPVDTPTDDTPQPPVDTPPVDTPPVDTPTDDTPEPPVDTPTDDTPQPPVDTPPVDTPPVDTPTDDTSEPPVDTPPVDTPTDDTSEPPVDTPTDDTPEPPVDTPTDNILGN